MRDTSVSGDGEVVFNNTLDFGIRNMNLVEAPEHPESFN